MNAPGGGTVLDDGIAQGWWLVVEPAEDGHPVDVVAGPFPEELDASCAALRRPDGTEGMRSVFGTRRADGTLLPRSSPQEQQWLAALGARLDRLAAGWDPELPAWLVTLVVEIAAALADAGLPLEDPLPDGRPGQRPGGVCLMPDAGQGGVLVSWRQHDRMSLGRVRGAHAEAAVQLAMDLAVGEVLLALGLAVEPFGSGTGLLVRPGDA